MVLLGGQGIWYDQVVHAPQLMTPAREATKATLRRELKSRLGLDEDRWVLLAIESAAFLYRRPASNVPR